jgi:hypothetical protein
MAILGSVRNSVGSIAGAFVVFVFAIAPLPAFGLAYMPPMSA